MKGAEPEPVARRILTILLSLYVATALVTTLGETLWLSWRLNADLLAEVDHTAQAVAEPLAQALWDFDEKQINILVGTLVSTPVVGRVRLEQDGGPVLAQGRPGSVAAARVYPLVHLSGGRSRNLGQLIIEPSTETLARRLAEAVTLAALRTTLLVAVLGGLLVVVGRRFVARPLSRLAEQVGTFDPDRPSLVPLVPDPEGGSEMARVVEAFRRLLGRYQATLGRVTDQQAQQRALIDSLPDLVWFKDPQGVYLACNRKFEQFFGHSEAEIRGKTDFDFVDAALAEEFRRNDALAISKGQSRSNEEEIVYASDGHHEWLETIKTPMHDREGRLLGVLGIGRDITERRRAALELERLIDELRRSHRLESLGNLAGGLAHEMNNVLAVILGVSSLQRTRTSDPAAAKAFEDIQRAADRGAGLVRNLLSFARHSPAEEKVFDWAEDLRAHRPLIESLAVGRVGWDFTLDPGPVWVKGDPVALVSAVLNLCGNAVDATPPGGSVRLGLRRGPDGAELEVADRGQGMSPEVRARALEPFFTTKEVGKGTGLGLPLVDAIVRAHGGSLELDSVWGRGTIARFRLPLAAAPAPSRGSAVTLSAPPTGGLSILVVDDDALVRESTLELLDALGHRSQGAAGGEEALALVGRGPEPDLIILDKNMPGLGGRATLVRLRLTHPTLPVLLATGQVDQEALDLVALDPALGVLSKPFTLEELDEKLKAVLGRS